MVWGKTTWQFNKQNRKMKEYGRKPYLSKTYYEMIRRPTKKALQNVKLQKESEFEKPYFDDEYPEMQHFAPRPGGDWDWPELPQIPIPTFPGFPEVAAEMPASGWWPGPGPGGAPPGQGRPKPSPWWPDTDPRPPGDTTCPPNLECDPRNPSEVDATTGCAKIFIGGMCGTVISARLLAVSGAGFEIKKSGNNFDCEHCQPSFFVEVCYTGSAGAATAYIEFVDTQFRLREGGQIRQTAYVVCQVDANCCEGTNISYSSGNPTTIGQSSEAAITVDDGCGPFEWEVSGTGFSFANATTTGRSNTLQTDGSACGPGDITVTDNCNDTATGTVRCTTGEWVVKETAYACGFLANCAFYQPAAEANCAITKELITGKQKWDFPGADGYCVYNNNGCTNLNDVDWDLASGGGACSSPVTYPPSCGSPSACNTGTCDGFWGDLEVGCVYRKYIYSEWECS